METDALRLGGPPGSRPAPGLARDRRLRGRRLRGPLRGPRPWASPRLRGAAAWALAGLAGLLLLLSSLAARQLRDPLAAASFPFADTDLARSALLLADPLAPAAVRGRALRFARAARDEAPARAETWLALAYARARADRAMSPAALEDLAQSYRLAPLDPDAARGRLVLALNVWDQLDPALRADALAEIDALWLRCAPDALDALQHSLPNASGRLGLNAEITRAELAWMRQHGQGQDLLDQADGGLEARRCQS